MTESTRNNELESSVSSANDGEFNKLVAQALTDMGVDSNRITSVGPQEVPNAEMRCCQIVDSTGNGKAGGSDKLADLIKSGSLSPDNKPDMFHCRHDITPGEGDKQPDSFSCAHRIIPGESQKQPDLFHCRHDIKPGETEKQPSDSEKQPDAFSCAHGLGDVGKADVFSCAHHIIPGQTEKPIAFACGHRINPGEQDSRLNDLYSCLHRPAPSAEHQRLRDVLTSLSQSTISGNDSGSGVVGSVNSTTSDRSFSKIGKIAAAASLNRARLERRSV